MDIKKLQKIVISALEDVKAQDIQLFDTTGLTSMFDRIVVVSGTSNRQTKALAMSVRDKVKEAGGNVLSMEGETTGEWVLVDLGDMVVHVMQPTIRAYYRLEELWGEKPISVATAKRPARKQADEAPKAKAKPKKAATAKATKAEEAPKKRSGRKAAEVIEEAPKKRAPRKASATTATEPVKAKAPAKKATAQKKSVVSTSKPVSPKKTATKTAKAALPKAATTKAKKTPEKRSAAKGKTAK